MQLGFTLDTHGTCVGELRDELMALEELANTWEFPYAIFAVFRVLPESYGRRTFRLKIHQARLLLSQEMGIYEVSQALKLPLEETEYILLRMNDDAPAAVHPDNL